MPGAEQIPPLAEQEAKAAAVVFQIRGDVLDAEGHVRLLRGNIEFLKEADEIRVGGMVEDHEPGIDGHRPPGFLHGDGIGMATSVVVFLEEGEIVVRVQKMGGPESGDAGTDDCDAGHGGGRRAVWPVVARERVTSCYATDGLLDGRMNPLNRKKRHANRGIIKRGPGGGSAQSGSVAFFPLCAPVLQGPHYWEKVPALFRELIGEMVRAGGIADLDDDPVLQQPLEAVC